MLRNEMPTVITACESTDKWKLMAASNFMETVVALPCLTSLYFRVLQDGRLYEVKQGQALDSAAGAWQLWMHVQPGE